MLFASYDEYAVNATEDAEDIAYLFSKDSAFSFLVISLRLRLSHKGSASVEAARHLTKKLLAHFDGFAQDDNGIFWDSKEIESDKNKNGLQFLEIELGYCR